MFVVCELALAGLVYPILLAAILLVEILAHGIVMYLSEVRGVHQKKMGFDWWIVQTYCDNKPVLFWSCLSFETFGLGLIINLPVVVLLSAPGFLFRAVANICRLMAVVTMGEKFG